MSARKPPLGEALSPTIAHFQQIAADAGNSLLCEGPVHPDYRLLEILAEAMPLLKEERLTAKERAGFYEKHQWTSAERANHDVMYHRQVEADRAAKYLLIKAYKLRATTPAGIYAKALAVRLSRAGAPKLAASLADDLIECEGLRQLLWPSERAGGAS